MCKTVKVGPLPVHAREQDLERLFSNVGTVVNCDVVPDGTTRVSKVIGIVEMSSDKEAQRAVSEFHGRRFWDRLVNVALMM